MYKVVFNDNRHPLDYRTVEHLDGGYIRCSSPTIDGVKTKRYPPTAIKEVIENPDGFF